MITAKIKIVLGMKLFNSSCLNLVKTISLMKNV